MKEFTTAATRGKAGVSNAVEIEFKLDDDVLTARPPTSGQIALFVQHARSGGLATITGLFQFFADVLDAKDWKIVEEKLRDGMDVDLLSDISSYLIGEWSGRPTKPSSVSSPTPNGTGPRSTAKLPRGARTTSPSPSIAS